MILACATATTSVFHIIWHDNEFNREIMHTLEIKPVQEWSVMGAAMLLLQYYQTN